MKIIRFTYIAFLFLVWGCEKGYIDEISKVDPGPDESAPQVAIKFPTEGTELKVTEAVTSVNIEFEVTDDIEVASIVLLMDDVEIATFSDFKDYRRVVDEYLYDNVVDGAHVLTITAEDIEGKTTSSSVTFSKAPAYVPLFDGEIFYMPFDGSYTDLVSITDATKVGGPEFADEGVLGESSYKGAANAYLTFPTEGLLEGEFSAAFWMKINATPDRAGILVIGPPDEVNPDNMNNRTKGFRFFREAAGDMQRFKLNVGTGESDSWFDGGENADVDPTTADWVHFAFTISGTEAKVYIDGQVVSEGVFDGVDWTDCDIISIMSGAPRFTEWGHLSDESLMDELRLFNKALSQAEIEAVMTESGGSTYEPVYDGETFYMPFDEDYTEYVSGSSATEVGSPGLAGESLVGADAYAGAADSYLSFPTAGLLGEEFSAVFWLKINAVPDRAGILVIGPPDEANPDNMNNRNAGFRFFREAAGDMQRFKLNVGSGESETWFDGGENADVDPTTGDWVHFAFTISATEAKVYINGAVVSEGEFDGVDWTGCDVISIMSGHPRFTEWGHLSDESFMDELRLFNKVLSQGEIDAIIDEESE